MKIIQSVALLSAVVILGPILPVSAAEQEGVAVVIVYDTSGSMSESVRDSNGKMASKRVIAQRALESIVRRLQAFATNTSVSAPRQIQAGLFAFNGQGTREIVKFSPFDPAKVESWTKNFPQPNSGTPLGNAFNTASQVVLKSGLSRKHVLVITDGLNNIGPDPAVILPRLKEQAAKLQTSFSAHFVAFDVDAKLFDPLKKLGATVVGAANEPQLNTQLGFILEKKILLEDEEPVKKK
jgi:Mg-chelatase subunit ChlD